MIHLWLKCCHSMHHSSPTQAFPPSEFSIPTHIGRVYKPHPLGDPCSQRSGNFKSRGATVCMTHRRPIYQTFCPIARGAACRQAAIVRNLSNSRGVTKVAMLGDSCMHDHIHGPWGSIYVLASRVDQVLKVLQQAHSVDGLFAPDCSIQIVTVLWSASCNFGIRQQ